MIAVFMAACSSIETCHSQHAWCRSVKHCGYNSHSTVTMLLLRVALLAVYSEIPQSKTHPRTQAILFVLNGLTWWLAAADPEGQEFSGSNTSSCAFGILVRTR